MTTEFDPHKIIRKLAEAEWVRKSLPDFASDPPGSIGTQSMEVPFASLRLGCRAYTHYRHSELAGEPSVHEETRCPGWIPEPAVERACCRVARIILELDPEDDIVAWWYNRTEHRWHWNNPRGENIPAESYIEAVLRAAEAWLEEKMKETP